MLENTHTNVLERLRNYVTARDVYYYCCCREVFDNRRAQLYWSRFIVNINANDSLFKNLLEGHLQVSDVYKTDIRNHYVMRSVK